jgi:hypothetical protein
MNVELACRTPRIIRSGHATLLAALLLASQATAAAHAAAAPPGLESLQEVGHGRLRWFGADIYQASLWSADGRAPGADGERALALSLAYERRFSRSELIRITAGEWQRLALAGAETRARWAVLLEGLWPDVRPGDTLTAIVLPGAETRFYDGRGPIGRIADPAFGPAYLAIWLDPRTAVRELRGELLGAGARR